MEPFLIGILDEKDGTQPVMKLTPAFYRSLRKITMADAPPADTQRTELAPESESPPMHWAVVGVSLALAFGTGGLWLFRSGSKVWQSRLALLLGLTAAGTLGGALVMAARPPQPPQTPDPKNQPLQVPIENRLRVELIDAKIDCVAVQVSRAYLEKLLEMTKPAPKQEQGIPLAPARTPKSPRDYAP
jgi:hypothetical protein